MPQERIRTGWTAGGVAARLWWAGLLGVHVMPFWKVSQGLLLEGLDPARVGAWVALVFTLGFFALKTGGVRFFPVESRVLAVAVFLAVCGIVHWGALPERDRPMLVAAAAVAVVGVAGARPLGRGARELWRRIRGGLGGVAPGPGFARVWVYIDAATERFFTRLAGALLACPRAPPAALACA